MQEFFSFNFRLREYIFFTSPPPPADPHHISFLVVRPCDGKKQAWSLNRKEKLVSSVARCVLPVKAILFIAGLSCHRSFRKDGVM